ncbi:MAG: hypothetical protein VCG02_09715 [Verrucomicrobiota bacterium]
MLKVIHETLGIKHDAMTTDYTHHIHPGIVDGFSTRMMELVRQVVCAMETG